MNKAIDVLVSLLSFYSVLFFVLVSVLMHQSTYSSPFGILLLSLFYLRFEILFYFSFFSFIFEDSSKIS